jgi:outer membrane lipoprotein-sorting protein
MIRHAFAFAAALTTPVALAAQSTGDLATVQRHLQALTTMTADFTQTDRNGKVLTGTFTLKRPGKLRFQYEKGVPILIVADGNSLWFFDYSVRQKQRWPIKNSPLGILIDNKIDIAEFGLLVPTNDHAVISVLVVDKKHPELGKINLIFIRSYLGPAGLILSGWVMIDSQNNRTTIRLTNHKFGMNIPNSRFVWNDPTK